MFEETAVATKPTASKSDFIRALPSTMTGPEVVEKARAAGIKVNEKYVYTIRYNARKAAKGKKPGRQPNPVHEFIFSVPREMALNDVVKAGAKKGLRFSASTVSYVRNNVTPPAKSGSRPSNASDFIRSLPATMTAAEVVEAAERKGLKLTSGLVYQVRKRARVPRVQSGAAKIRAHVHDHGHGRGHRHAHGHAHGNGGASEADFRKLAFELGIARSRELLDGLEQRLTELIAG